MLGEDLSDSIELSNYLLVIASDSKTPSLRFDMVYFVDYVPRYIPFWLTDNIWLLFTLRSIFAGLIWIEDNYCFNSVTELSSFRC